VILSSFYLLAKKLSDWKTFFFLECRLRLNAIIRQLGTKLPYLSRGLST
jgi:hypothetical protein